MANLHGDLALRQGYEGITDATVPLSQWGYGQALEAGKRMQDELGVPEREGRNLKIIASPFLRTQQTTQGVLQGMGCSDIEHSNNAHLREQDFGLFNCITDRKTIARLWPEEHKQFVQDRKSDKFHAKAPGGESRADVVERAKLLIEEHRTDFEDPNTDVILVGHGMVNRAVEMCLRGEDTEWLRKEPNPGNCAIRKLEGDLKHGYSAEYIHNSKTRPACMPKDYKAAPHGIESQRAI